MSTIYLPSAQKNKKEYFKKLGTALVKNYGKKKILFHKTSHPCRPRIETSRQQKTTMGGACVYFVYKKYFWMLTIPNLKWRMRKTEYTKTRFEQLSDIMEVADATINLMSIIPEVPVVRLWGFWISGCRRVV